MRLGIREKILAIYGLGFAMILTISAGVQIVAHGAGIEFETRLNRYYAMQSLRVSLSELRKKGDLYLRAADPELRRELEAALVSLPMLARELQVLEPGPGEIAFRAVAVRRGLSAYLTEVRSAFEAGQAGAADAYLRYLEADKVAGYVDRYLDILLSESLEDGTLWYRNSSARSEVWGLLALGANGAALVAATVLAFLLAGSISGPIRRLALVSEKMAAGDLDVDPVLAATGDEVETLARSFSIMAQNLRGMVEGLHDKARLEQQVHRDELALVELDRNLKESRFFALQSRIRPHFLFNALNTVARSAQLEGALGTEELTRRLAALMRYSLGSGQAFVTVAEELGIVREYLSFQGIRFGSRLGWSVDADPGALEAPIPRFTLQPLVENAVLHGIEPQVAGGRVVVSARLRPRSVRLVVADSGRGMEPSTLARVRASVSGQTLPDFGVGTASLESRLVYLYHHGVRSAVYSRPGRGTLMVIVIPRGGPPHG